MGPARHSTANLQPPRRVSQPRLLGHPTQSPHGHRTYGRGSKMGRHQSGTVLDTACSDTDPARRSGPSSAHGTAERGPRTSSLRLPSSWPTSRSAQKPLAVPVLSPIRNRCGAISRVCTLQDDISPRSSCSSSSRPASSIPATVTTILVSRTTHGVAPIWTSG